MDLYYALVLLHTFSLNSFSSADLLQLRPCTDLVRCAEVTLQNCECGTPLESRIVGGEITQRNEFPWQVAIGLKNFYPRCGGVLISDLHVLTAAHCLVSLQEKLSDVFIYLGLYDFFHKKSALKMRVKNLTMHKKFRKEKGMNDIAVIELARSVKFNEKVSPICFPPPGRNYIGLMATVTGWGRIYHKGPSSATLLKVEVPVRDEPICHWKIKEKKKVKSQICAYYDEGFKDSCEGDSGSPMMIKNESRWYLIGLVVMGWGCAQPKTPALYTRVDYFYSWINRFTKGGVFCQF